MSDSFNQELGDFLAPVLALVKCVLYMSMNVL